jgi:RHS repeat-associated protein
MTAIVDANANATGNAAVGTTTMTYDTLNRPMSKTYSDGTPTVSYVYDAQGRVSSMTDGTGTWTYGFDAADRVNQISKGTDSWAYTYDTGGNVTGRTVPGGANSTALFDDVGQLGSVSDAGGNTVFGYDPVGNMTSMQFPNGVVQARVYDRAAQLATITNTGPVNVAVGGYAYVRDLNGNPLNVDVSGPTGIIVAESMRNTYDNADRLTKTCFTTTTCAAANQSTWSYNAVGSRLTEKIGSAAVSTYTYDLADQLTAITGPGAATFTYNPNGDQLTAGADTFTDNTARQTTGATVGGVASTYAYDWNGNRNTVTTGGVVTGEVWDTMGGLPTLVAQRTAAGVVQRKYTYVGATPLRFEDTVAGTTGYYQTDGIGSVSNITSATGAIVATYRYSPYGTTRTATAVIPGYAANPMRYTGQQQDPTGNYNLRARQYNPGRGAFTQTDPTPYGAGSAYESSYVYAGDMPTVMVDVSGLRFTNRAFSALNPLSLTAEDPVANSEVVRILDDVLTRTGRDLTMFAARFVITCPAVTAKDRCHEGLANATSSDIQLYDGKGKESVVLASGDVAIRPDRLKPTIIVHEALHLEGNIPFDATIVKYTGTNPRGQSKSITPADPSGLRGGIPQFELATDCETQRLVSGGPLNYINAANKARASLNKQGYKVSGSVC